METKKLAAFSAAHFCVDGMCAVLLWASFGQLHIPVLVLLAYHALAFGIQPVVGSFCDDHREFPAGVLGVALTALGCLCAIVFPWGGVVLAGIGNSLFHVAGGYVSLHHNSTKLAPGGVFVAGGAMGITLGGMAGKLFPPVWILLMAALILGGVGGYLCARMDVSAEVKKQSTVFQVIRTDRRVGWVLAVTVLSIVIRGYAGLIVPMDWKTQSWMGILTGCALMLGKGSGGFLADRFGAKRVSVTALLLAIPCMWCSGIAPLSLLGIFLLNIPMSVTLAALCSCMPENTGLAFGLAPLGLFIGYALNMLYTPSGLTAKLLITAMYALSACMLWMTLRARTDDRRADL